MIDDLDAESLVAEVIMCYSGHGAVLVVEGDLDEEFAEEYLLPEGSVVNARGKSRIIAVIDKLISLRVPVVVLLDRDFDIELGAAISHPDVIYTDRYNLESSLLLDPAVFRRVWALHIPRNLRVSVDSNEALHTCETVADTIGRLRFVSVKLQLELAMDGFPVEPVLRRARASVCCEVDLDELVALALRRSKNSEWVARKRRRKHDGHMERACKEVARRFAQVDRESCCDFCSGHDAASVLSVLIAGLRNRGAPSATDLERHAVREFGAAERHQIEFVEQVRKRLVEVVYAA